MQRNTVLLVASEGAYRDRDATALEYPVESFTEAVELDTDLVVDLAKQTEGLVHTADRFQLPTRPA